MTAQPFRLLDLPPELRLMIYERIPITIHRHVFEDPTFKHVPASTITIVTKSIPVGILATCRLVHEECKSIMDGELKRLKQEPLRLIVDSTSLSSLFGPLSHMESLAMRIMMQRDRISRYGALAPAPATPITLAIPDHYKGYSSFETNTPEHTSIMAFINKCATHMTSHLPCRTVVAMRHHPKHNDSDFGSAFNNSVGSLYWSGCVTGLKPLVWMPYQLSSKSLIQAARDNINSTNSLVLWSHQILIEDVEDEEWFQIWGGGEIDMWDNETYEKTV